VPIPKPNPNEKEQDFVSRCMGNDTMNEEYPEQEQRAAVCYDVYRRSKKKDEAVSTVNRINDSEAEFILYGDIGGHWDGVQAKDVIDQIKPMGNLNHINLRLNSAGGDVYEGVAIYNYLAQHPAQVTVNIDGWALSIASIVAMAGDNVRMADNAIFMMHNPWTMVLGDADELRKQAGLLEQVKKNTLIKTYMKKSNLSFAEVNRLMQEETWLSADDAQAYGFVDEVTESLRIAARGDITKFKHPPHMVMDRMLVQDAEDLVSEQPRPNLAKAREYQMRMRNRLQRYQQNVS
jgi:ATP-dependent protease ClpP protease subunit